MPGFHDSKKKHLPDKNPRIDTINNSILGSMMFHEIKNRKKTLHLLQILLRRQRVEAVK